MGNHYGLNEPNELESYGGLEHIREYRKTVDERNSNKVMHAQFDLIKEQRQEIFEQCKYREEQRKYIEEQRKTSKLSTRLLIISIIISFIALVISILDCFK
ncbi:hypothetical protein [Butyricimonas virosa]|uniref:hypothetical protein n=1 Tax=Butyricimonas virosa TaxID=544645 RepID=UPI00266BB4DA|nr:hypothetical protein [Butyricimonas virosa]